MILSNFKIHHSILLVFILLSWKNIFAFQKSDNQVSGYVFSKGTPLHQANISNLRTKVATTSNEKGKYEILASSGDTLKFSYISLKEVFKVVDKTTVLNVSINEEKIENLEEVALTGHRTRRKSQKDLLGEYNTNPDLIKTQFGILDQKTAPFTLYILDEGDFNTGAPDFLTAISGRFTPPRSAGSSGPSGPAFDVDGMVTGSPPPINLASIKRIAFIPGLAGVTRYGTIAINGIYIINTKGGNPAPNPAERAVQDPMNVYDDSAKALGLLDKEYSPFSIELYSCTTEEEAINLVEKQMGKHMTDTEIIDSYDYFMSIWNQPDSIQSIFENKLSLFKKNPEGLKALAFYHEYYGQFENAKNLYIQLLGQHNNDPQSYLDLAQVYESLNDYGNALKILLRYFHLVKIGFLQGKGGTHSILEKDLNNIYRKLITHESALSDLPDSINIKEMKKEIATNFKGVRIVFEWNSLNTEFSLQFVDPTNRYYKWQPFAHTEFNGAKEINNGLYSEEFLIDQSLPGTWLINAEYLGNSSSPPVYLMATIYFNFGQENERKELKIFRLNEPKLNQKLLGINIHRVVYSY